MGPRDSHSACIWNDRMIIFGGFAKGVKTDAVHSYCFKDG